VFATVDAADWVVDGRDLDVEQAITRTMKVYRSRDLYRDSLKAKVQEAQAKLSETFRKLLDACGESAVPNAHLKRPIFERA
jgi:hypothetical protein